MKLANGRKISRAWDATNTVDSIGWLMRIWILPDIISIWTNWNRKFRHPFCRCGMGIWAIAILNGSSHIGPPPQIWTSTGSQECSMAASDWQSLCCGTRLPRLEYWRSSLISFLFCQYSNDGVWIEFHSLQRNVESWAYINLLRNQIGHKNVCWLIFFLKGGMWNHHEWRLCKLRMLLCRIWRGNTYDMPNLP